MTLSSVSTSGDGCRDGQPGQHLGDDDGQQSSGQSTSVAPVRSWTVIKTMVCPPPLLRQAGCMLRMATAFGNASLTVSVVPSSVTLAFRRMSLACPEGLSSAELRRWVLEQLRKEGEPLRWAITSADLSCGTSTRSLEVEAVLIQS